MAVHPLRPATRRRLGRPLPHQQADRPRAHLAPKKLSNHHTKGGYYPVLDPVSQAYPRVQGRSPTCYSPVRHSSTPASRSLSVRLACVKHAASVRPEPGSNSPQKGREKPKPNKKNKPNRIMRTHHAHTTRTGKSKNYIKKKSNQPPTRRGTKKEAGHVRRFSIYAQTTYVIYNDAARKKRHPAYTNRNTHTAYHSQNDQKSTNTKKYIGTLLSSHTSSAHSSIRTFSVRPSERLEFTL